MSPDRAPTALGHLRVLELSRIMAGPWCGQILADLGADLVKVERPGRGDDTRGWGPPFLHDDAGRDTGESAYYLSANRGKRSITADLSTPAGRDTVRDLAARADVLIENFSAGTLAGWSLDYASLRALNPRLVYCSITGFGQSGPRAGSAGYDFMMQASGGLMSVTGPADGEPHKVGVPICDLMTGMYSTVAILAAIASRDRTGEGQYVDMALFDVQVAMLANQASSYLISGEAPGRMGNAHPTIAPYQSFAALDQAFALAIGNDRQFQRFCELAGRPGLAADPRFATNAARIGNRAALVETIGALTQSQPRDEWLRLLDAAGIPCGPINTLDEVFDDPQVAHRGMRTSAPHPTGGTVPLVASPLRLSATPVVAPRAPPTLGQHTDEVLRDWLDLDDDAIAGLRDAGALGPGVSAKPSSPTMDR